MASSAFKPSSTHNSALMELARFLEPARGGERTIALPRHILEAVRDSRPSETEMNALIQAIEPGLTTPCERIDCEGLLLLCWTFLHSTPCLAQQRGLCLIAESLYHYQSDSPEKTALKRSKKLVIGKHAINALIKGFIDLEKSEIFRRWVGVLVLELLEDCADNAEKLKSDPARLRSLSHLVKHGKCRVFTLIAGSIVRILLNHGVLPEELCLTEDDRTLYSKFPKSKHHDIDWVLAFGEFVDEVVMANILVIQRSDVLYAFGLDAGFHQYNTVDNSAILVTVTKDEDLRIVVSASPTGPAVYVDVPLRNIQDTTIESVWNAESQAHRYAVTIELTQAVRNAWYHDAVGRKDKTMSIAFSSPSHAETLIELLQQPKKVRTTGRPTVMESQPIDCSEAALNGEFARPNLALTHSQSLAGVALQANSLLIQSSSNGISNHKNAALPSTSQNGITKHVSESGQEVEIHHDTQRPASSVSSAVEGIDVSQPDRANCGETNSKAPKSTAHADGQVIESPRPTGTSADVEFGDSPGPNNDGSHQQDQVTKYQDQGYDSSYDISPRASRIRTKSRDNAVTAMQPKPSRPPGNNRTLPTTDNNPTEKPPLSKPRRSLRNNDGNIEAGVESQSTLELERAAGTLMKNITTSKPSDNREVAAPAKSKVGLQKSHFIKKAKEGKGKGQAPKGKDQEHVEDEYNLPGSPNGKDRNHIEDEYDLPLSPKAPVRKLEASIIQGKASPQAPDRAIQQKPKPKRPVKAAISLSSVPSKRLEAQPKPAHAPKPPPEKAVRPAKSEANKDAGDASIWDAGLENSNEDHETSPKQKTKAKRVAKKPARDFKGGKSKTVEIQPKKISSQASLEYIAKAKPAANLAQTRSRRAAALIANKKIQGLEESDEIVEEVEEPVSMSRKKPTTPTNKVEIQPSLTEIPEKEVLKDTDKAQASVNSNAKNITLSKDTVPSIRPDEYANSEASSVENVELVSTTTRHGIVQAGTTSIARLPPTNPDLLEAQGTSSYGGKERGLTGVDVNGDIHNRSQNREKGCIPESITEDFRAASKEEGSIIEPILEIDEGARPLGMVGDAEDRHFQEAMPEMEAIDRRENGTMNDETSEIRKNTATSQIEEGHSHMTRQEVQNTKRTTQYVNQTSIKPERSRATPGDSKARDPFEAKLSLLTPDNETSTATMKERAKSHMKQTSKASKEYNGGQHRVDEGKDVRSTGLVNDSGRVTQDETQDVVGIVQQEKNSSINAKSGLHKKIQARQRSPKDKGPMKESVQTEQEQNVGLTQPQQAISKHNSPGIPVAAVENKRKAVHDGVAREKRPKLTPSNEHKTPLHGKNENLLQPTANATSTSAKGKPIKMRLAEMHPPDINRKPEIISFSAEGPKNQGSASIKKPKPVTISTGMQTDDSKQAAPGKELELLKRKAASRVDDPAPSAYEQPPKRQKQYITPPTKHNHVPQMIPEPTNSIAVQEMPNRVSSQSTRVDENGSPMPSVHARHDMVAQTHGYKKDEEVAGSYLITDVHTEDGVSYAEGDILEDDPSLPLTIFPPLHQGHNAGFDRFSSNSKGKYGSPTAPSNFASMPAHYMFQDGTIVNSQTKENIVPSEPQDPFTGAGQVGTSDFIRALRRKSGTEGRSQDDLLSRKGTAINAKRQIPACTEDPEKTLVEIEPPRKQRKRDVISIGSTITSSSSGLTASAGVSSSIEASSLESDAQWRKAFEPHQGDMLGVLTEISHRLMRHLVDKEQAIQDAVQDYVYGGSKLIEFCERECQRALGLNKAQLDHFRSELSKGLEKFLAEVMEIAEKFDNARNADFERQWNVEQDRLMDAAKQEFSRFAK
ncbi:hypothetical protein JMJ35_001217 [Cladonia borealis]|uniref:Uncharacterized protein n=1 Tax=Cladonia borealis TaxID=184061 RepID=A0AA39V7L1_9LECA|nr:hypothetical protein JMJ35_001217 [Cladonia borealis]